MDQRVSRSASQSIPSKYIHNPFRGMLHPAFQILTIQFFKLIPLYMLYRFYLFIGASNKGTSHSNDRTKASKENKSIQQY